MINYKSFAFIAFPKAAWERFQDNFPWQIENHKKQTIMKFLFFGRFLKTKLSVFNSVFTVFTLSSSVFFSKLMVMATRWSNSFIV